MNETIINVIKDIPITIPRIILKYYKKLNITEEELIVLICLINKGQKSPYDPNLFTEELGMNKYQAMQLITDLQEKNIIDVKLETNKYGKKEEYIYTDLLYNKIYSILLDDNNVQEEKTPSKDIYLKFENEIGRTTSPAEVEQINEWINDGTTEELIEEALKEAVYNNVRNLKYIDRIIYNWKSKGIKNKNDIIKEKKNFRKTQVSKEEIYDYNWLEEE